MAFLNDQRFVVAIEPVHCSTDDPECLSVFLPGGMESVRLYTEEGSHTLFNGSFGGDYDAIVINDAPGYQMEFGSIKHFDPNFEWDPRDPVFGGDCTMYLQSIDDGFFVCRRQVGDVMILGWAVCPQEIHNVKRCQNDTSWTSNVQWNSTISMFSRRATVAYDVANVSIISVDSISPPQQIATPGDMFALYCSVIMRPITEAVDYKNDSDTYGFSSTVYTFGYGISWLLRFYAADLVTYVDGGRSLLRSFVAVPFQFSTVMRQFGGRDQMPPENHVIASLSKSEYRAFTDAWTVWVFAALAFILTLWCMLALAWITFAGPWAPNLSFFPEINITSKSSVSASTVREDEWRAGMDPHLQVAPGQDGPALEDLGRLTRVRGLGNGMSSDVIRSITGQKVYCGSVPGKISGERVIVLVTEGGRVQPLNRHERYA
jgi:hypothetical protein